ncbi:hypothetical protein ANCDUO_06284 [Ancylostoma duodenale]|uniref:Uncharacterized protein n=1 Tax=Ancylostoma duodenale TaxID=51022 RepID=A0A0C2H222_9BILA|nr:hypothetical protein ANCDUO_06284 [Ancylostoma duodenale]
MEGRKARSRAPSLKAGAAQPAEMVKKLAEPQCENDIPSALSAPLQEKSIPATRIRKRTIQQLSEAAAGDEKMSSHTSTAGYPVKAQPCRTAVEQQHEVVGYTQELPIPDASPSPCVGAPVLFPPSGLSKLHGDVLETDEQVQNLDSNRLEQLRRRAESAALRRLAELEQERARRLQVDAERARVRRSRKTDKNRLTGARKDAERRRFRLSRERSEVDECYPEFVDEITSVPESASEGTLPMGIRPVEETSLQAPNVHQQDLGILAPAAVAQQVLEEIIDVVVGSISAESLATSREAEVVGLPSPPIRDLGTALSMTEPKENHLGPLDLDVRYGHCGALFFNNEAKKQKDAQYLL